MAFETMFRPFILKEMDLKASLCVLHDVYGSKNTNKDAKGEKYNPIRLRIVVKL